jgi:hypothetical protein
MGQQLYNWLNTHLKTKNYPFMVKPQMGNSTQNRFDRKWVKMVD